MSTNANELWSLGRVRARDGDPAHVAELNAFPDRVAAPAGVS